MWMGLTLLAWPQGLKARALAMVMARQSLALKMVPHEAMPKLRCPPRSLTELQTWIRELTWTQCLLRTSSLVAGQVLKV